MALSTLCPDLDACTNGGIQKGIVTELCGEEGVGKTCLAMQLCLSTQLGMNGDKGCAVYVYTKSPFPVQRLHQIASHLLGEDKVRQALENVHTWHSCDPNELSQLLTEVDNFIKNKVDSRIPVKLLVIDSLCDFYFNRYPYTKEGTIEKTDLMRAVGYALKRMGTKYGVAVVICNGVVDSFARNNVKNFVTSNRFVRPKFLTVLEKNINVRWLLAKKFNDEGGIFATMSYPEEEKPRLEYIIAPYGISAIN